MGEPFSLQDPVPLVYISKDRKCYLITADSTTFLSIVSEWKKRLTPYSDLAFYDSREAAGIDYPIIDFEKTKEYRDLMQLMRK